jgi:molybdopterin-binding protein
MPTYGVREAALVLGVSDDSVRRWGESGRLELVRQPNGHRAVDGLELAQFAVSLGDVESAFAVGRASARNRLHGIVTKVLRDEVMAQIDLQCGRNRMSSLISREAADELELEPGVLAVASVKATNVIIELPLRAE